jgi:DNA-binding phage protein
MNVAAFDNFRLNLATAIEARSLKKTDVAASAHTSRAYLDKVIKGQTEPGISNCESLARAVGFPLAALLVSPPEFSESLLTNVPN